MRAWRLRIALLFLWVAFFCWYAFPIDPWFQLGDPRLLLAALFGLVALALPRRRAKH
jgi:hypothetical protein